MAPLATVTLRPLPPIEPAAANCNVPPLMFVVPL